MGADLLLHHVWIDRNRKPDWDAAKTTIMLLSDEKLDSAQMEAYGEGSDEGREPMRKQLLVDLEEVRSTWEGGFSRDAYVCDLGPITCLLTGGMSWGDSPSEFFDVISRLSDTPALDDAGFWKWEHKEQS